MMTHRTAYLMVGLVTLAYLVAMAAAGSAITRLLPWSSLRAFHLDGSA